MTIIEKALREACEAVANARDYIARHHHPSGRLDCCAGGGVMREIKITELKTIIDNLADQHPNAVVDFVYPKRHAGKPSSALGHLSGYEVLLDTSVAHRAIVRVTLDHARTPIPADEGAVS